MHDVRDSIEKGLRLFLSLIEADATLDGEFRGSYAQFFASGLAERQDRAMASRRHLEWFVLERPSEKLGGVPAEALQEEWLQRAEPDVADLGLTPYLRSIASVFELTSAEETRGVWLRDLSGHGEYPIDERDAVLELAVGDLLVGRLFPIDGGVFLLSSAVSCFRNRTLVDAVRGDLESMRGARRGVLRIQQLDLERLFFSPTPIDQQNGDVPTIDLAVERSNARAALREAGLDSQSADELLAIVRETASRGQSLLSDVLDELAFSTNVDLEAARLVLTDLWSLECEGQAHSAAAAVPDASTNDATDPSDAASTDEVRAALDAFRAGRENGGDLHVLFDELADKLGVDLPKDDPLGLDLPVLPDEAVPVPLIDPPQEFPGVVGALVEEFLWDVRREQGAHVGERMEGLRRLSDYATDIGTFENLGRRQVLDFAGRWLLDSGELRGPEEARAVLAALCAFCRWSEEHHGHPLWTDCEDLLDALADSIPRLVLARQHTIAAEPGDSVWDVVDVSLELVVLRDASGEERRVRASRPLEQCLRDGDVVHARVVDGATAISVAYPSELRELLQSASND